MRKGKMTPDKYNLSSLNFMDMSRSIAFNEIHARSYEGIYEEKNFWNKNQEDINLRYRKMEREKI